MILLFSCHTICQKSFFVLSRHPCVAMYVLRGGSNNSGGASDEAARGGAARRVAIEAVEEAMSSGLMRLALM